MAERERPDRSIILERQGQRLVRLNMRTSRIEAKSGAREPPLRKQTIAGSFSRRPLSMDAAKHSTVGDWKRSIKESGISMTFWT